MAARGSPRSKFWYAILVKGDQFSAADVSQYRLIKKIKFKLDWSANQTS